MMTRLPRELVDVSDEVRNVPAPPIPQMPAPFSLRVADPDADAAMISEWMNRPHLVKTWGYNGPPSEWHLQLRAQLEGTYSRPLIGSRDGKDYAYIEIFRVAKDYVSTIYDADPYDIGFHSAIADPSELDSGVARDFGPAAFMSVFDLEPRCRRIVFDPESSNPRVRAILERFGCAHLGEHILPGGRKIVLYAYLRSPDDIPKLRN